MKLYRYPEQSSWKALLQRPVADAVSLTQRVRTVLDDVKQNGDAAVKHYTKQFDNVELNTALVSAADFEEAEQSLSEELKQAILTAKNNIVLFHEQQISQPVIVETMPGVQCWRKSVGIERVGLYIPGGSAPLFSTILMLGVPAVLAGCREIVLCSPPDANGKLHPAILFAAKIVGVTKVFRIGGVQAIAAMAYGTETVPSVYKIFGPGNQYVTCAKQLVQQEGLAIDMPAGPSEVAVFADDTVPASFIAADLLSQAEHGADSQVLLVTCSEKLIGEVEAAVAEQLAQLPRKDIAAQALTHSKLILMRDETSAMDLLNEYAAEHLILSCANAAELAEKVINAGSVFLGNYSPESVGDYASGTNHTLPTNGYARAYSGVSVDSFVRKITFQQLSYQGLQSIGSTVIQMAEAEGLQAHANAVKVRLQ
ncbi:histidinol dehydrogenase [Pseudoflavitalea sp. G-6-1-2]|uniref:histidinol dehydrogenase n=1 Tax=Pseudoflavitalea sp. G-6-1-2 TaxID=2728841 RepID=UPI00146C0020|nr:histidinol dehydrogenase [Pseudoflavitalea sp. G-6-1-2]NML23376.1 histidinol dehydrogenase [Pseudoflavitalea sp. G-6-1-2]